MLRRMYNWCIAAAAKPYAEWLNKYKIRLEELPEPRVLFTHLEHDHPLGKVVLLPNAAPGSIGAHDARATTR